MKDEMPVHLLRGALEQNINAHVHIELVARAATREYGIDQPSHPLYAQDLVYRSFVFTVEQCKRNKNSLTERDFFFTMKSRSRPFKTFPSEKQSEM